MTSKVQERIERCRRVRIQQRLPQTRLAGLADGYVLPFVPGITETAFPIPCLEVIADPSHLTAEPHVKEVIVISELLATRPGVVDAAEANASSNWETRPIREEVRNSRVCYRERIPRIYDWHTDAGWTERDGGAGDLERIRRKRHRCQRGIEKRPRNLKIAKHAQVFVAQIAGE